MRDFGRTPSVWITRSSCPINPCPGAGVFTTNRFCAAPVQVSRANLGGADKGYGIIAGVSVNSGNANAATGETGLACARETCSIASQVIGCEPQQILVASTGVIGQILPIDTFETAIPAAYEALLRPWWRRCRSRHHDDRHALQGVRRVLRQ